MRYFVYLRPKIESTLKKLIYIFLLIAAMSSCAEKKQDTLAKVDDERYQWESIRKHIMENPELAFAMVDTAQTLGVADINYANWMRAQIHLVSHDPKDTEKGKEYCLMVLNNEDPAPDSLQRVKTLQLLVGISMNDSNTYQDAIAYAMEGAKIAHEHNWNGEEANFYFNAGLTMENVQTGSGKEYLDRSLEMFRASKNINAMPLFASHLGAVARLAINAGDYVRGAELTKERLAVTERIEREHPSAPKGYIDQQKAYIYSLLAFCQYKEGDKAGARRSAEAFEQTKAGKHPDHMRDIFNYYIISGDSERIQEIYDILEPYYREKNDTISNVYADLLKSYAIGLDNMGRGHDAYQAMERYTTLADSLVQRERCSETLALAQQMKTQEKEIQLKEKETEARFHWIIIICLVAMLIIGTIALWRIIAAQNRLQEKNRQLYDTVQKMMQHEAKEQEKVLSESTSSSQQLYGKLCELMREQKPYTDSDLNRETLAQMLGTNYNAIAAAIREFADGITIGDFLDDWRIRHAASLLRDSDEPVGIVAEMSGFRSRSHFNTLFRDKYKLTPSEYSRVAKEKK